MDDITIRRALRDDVPAIVRLLADDPLGRNREEPDEPLSDSYWEAFDKLRRDPNAVLAVVQDSSKTIIGCLQLNFMIGLSHQGAGRMLIEDVRVDKRYRNRHIGHRLLDWAVDQAKQKDCQVVELFVHQSRTDARRFYESLGFEANHTGMRLLLG
ncbi:N-acetyltransferase family protein [Hypericibacter sp.]|uniref:GNAT family N-acetyltransferase n=1 Tax=Hypericibacter sp. TaxID=2705401 RepID=UPI003D6CAB44